MLHLEHSFIWCRNLDASGSRSETPGKFLNVVLEKDGEDQLDWSCGKWKSTLLLRVKEQRNILHEISKRKSNWIGHSWRRNCLLQRVIEGKIKGGIEVTGRRGTRRRELLDDLKERRGYFHLKEEALDRTMWRDRFGRGFGPVVRQTAKWMNEYRYSYCCYSVLLIFMRQITESSLLMKFGFCDLGSHLCMKESLSHRHFGAERSCYIKLQLRHPFAFFLWEICKLEFWH